jgi:diadenosine tetraphosphate (Ap4A) HIT family hydrolase
MISNNLYRKPNLDKKYAEYLELTAPKKQCAFCYKKDMNYRNLDANLKHFWVIKPLAPYSYWDEREVIDHLIVIPIRHVIYLSELTNKESVEYLSLIKKYFKPDYSIFTRNYGSVEHLHTHVFNVREYRLGLKIEYFSK